MVRERKRITGYYSQGYTTGGEETEGRCGSVCEGQEGDMCMTVYNDICYFGLE